MPEEKKKISKGIKWTIGIGILIVFSILANIFGETEGEAPLSDEESEEETTLGNEENKPEESERLAEQSTAQSGDKEESKEITVNEQFEFNDYTLTINNVTVENNQATIHMRFANDSYMPELRPSQSILLDVYQDEELIDEINDHYYENALNVGMETSFSITYELIDKDTPIDIVIMPTSDDNEESEELRIDL